MNFYKESKSDFLRQAEGCWDEKEAGVGRVRPKIIIRLFCVLVLLIQIQVPSPSCSLVVKQTIGVTNRKGA